VCLYVCETAAWIQLLKVAPGVPDRNILFLYQKVLDGRVFLSKAAAEESTKTRHFGAFFLLAGCAFALAAGKVEAVLTNYLKLDILRTARNIDCQD